MSNGKGASLFSGCKNHPGISLMINIKHTNCMADIGQKHHLSTKGRVLQNPMITGMKHLQEKRELRGRLKCSRGTASKRNCNLVPAKLMRKG